MEKRKQSQNAKLPMLELIINIGVFAIISMFLLEMFLAANSLQQKAKDQGIAITKAETIAENIKSEDSFLETQSEFVFTKMWGTMTEEKDGSYQITELSQTERKDATIVYILHFNENWEPVTEEDTYTMLIVPYTKKMQDGIVENYEVYAYRLTGYPSLFQKQDHVALYELNFSKYRGMD